MLAFLPWLCFMHSLQVETVTLSAHLLLSSIMVVGVIQTGVAEDFFEAIVAIIVAVVAAIMAIVVATSTVLYVIKLSAIPKS